MNINFKIVFLALTFFVNISNGQIIPTEDNSLNEKNRQEIFDFIEYVISQSNLKKDQKLILKTFDDYNINKTFLEKFLIDTILKGSEKKLNNLTKDSINGPYFIPREPISISLPARPKVLTIEEINYMLEQKKYAANFKWDNAIFNFNQANDEKWYNISLPLFSMDKTKVIVTILDGCTGLCGTGNTYLFIKNNEGWKKETVSHWVH